MVIPRSASLIVAITVLAPTPVLAHSFGRIYNLPVPVWMYLWGASAALLLSFLAIGYFVTTTQSVDRNLWTKLAPTFLDWLLGHELLKILRWFAVAMLLLCICTGIFGTRNAYANFNMTFFWVVFVLGYTYWVALAGDSWRHINPWHALVDATGRSFTGQRPYPIWLGYYPALGLYAAFIWIELFAETRPYSLSWVLLGYIAINFLGAWWWGKSTWFRYAEFFSVFFRIIAMIAPFERINGQLHFRHPFIGLLKERCESLSLLLFVLFMLSSTAFDGLHETATWVRVYWRGVLALLQPFVGNDIVATFPFFKKLYVFWQTAALLLSPLIYLAAFAAALAMTRRLTGSSIPLSTLCLEFGYTLVPIAFVYHVTHYYTLLQTQGLRIIELASDPFGWGWNLFGTRNWLAPIIPDAGTVWHAQVALILLGHVISVYLAHVVSMRLFGSRNAAIFSQTPMLLLMVLYTTAGLWILSLPIQAGVVMPP